MEKNLLFGKLQIEPGDQRIVEMEKIQGWREKGKRRLVFSSTQRPGTG